MTLQKLSQQFSSNEWPDFLDVQVLEGSYLISLHIGADIRWFEGHFPEQPVLAGVVQTHWAAEIGKLIFDVADDSFSRIDNLKFQTVILPGQRVNLHLEYLNENRALKFRYSNESVNFSEGSLFLIGMMLSKIMTYCLLIPHFNHERQLVAFLPRLIATGLPCVIVDDGSTDQSVSVLKAATAPYSNIYVFEQRRNRGKGAAVKAGIYHARALGFTHAVQIDADGQHNTEDLPTFLEASRQHPLAIICGKPVFDDSAPKARIYGRKVTDFWVALETLSLKIKDGLCGFRVYPLAQVEDVLDRFYLGNRMDFDTELLVKAVWMEVQLLFIKTQVIYPEQNISHFNYLRDNLMLIRLHTRLMLGMLIRLPKSLWRIVQGKH